MAYRGAEVWARELIFRPVGARLFPALTHGSRRGLHSFAASRLQTRDCAVEILVLRYTLKRCAT